MSEEINIDEKGSPISGLGSGFAANPPGPPVSSEPEAITLAREAGFQEGIAANRGGLVARLQEIQVRTGALQMAADHHQQHGFSPGTYYSHKTVLETAKAFMEFMDAAAEKPDAEREWTQGRRDDYAAGYEFARQEASEETD